MHDGGCFESTGGIEKHNKESCTGGSARPCKTCTCDHNLFFPVASKSGAKSVCFPEDGLYIARLTDGCCRTGVETSVPQHWGRIRSSLPYTQAVVLPDFAISATVATAAATADTLPGSPGVQLDELDLKSVTPQQNGNMASTSHSPPKHKHVKYNNGGWVHRCPTQKNSLNLGTREQICID